MRRASDPSFNSTSSHLKRLWPVLTCLGLLLIAAGFLWQWQGDASQWLSREDAEKYVESAVALHGQTMRPHAGEDESPELAYKRAQLAEAAERVDTARIRYRWAPRVLQALGAILAGTGIIGIRWSAVARA